MEINQKLYRGIINYLENEERTGIHISHLKYPCIRRAFYDMTKERNYDWETAWKFFIGKKIHEVPLEEFHELNLEWETEYGKIYGTCDEYDPEKEIVYDKKTTRNPPHYNKKYARDHDQKQVIYYGVLLEANDYPVKRGKVMYIDVSKEKPSIMIKPVDLPDNLGEDSEIGEEIKEKQKILVQSLKEEKPPERNPNDWLCAYCNWLKSCYKEEI